MQLDETPVATLGDRSSLALFLDIDGTLVPIAPTPAEVRPSPDLPRLLTRAAADLGNALAIVSGREITSIDQVTQNAVPYVAGSHGAEFRLGFGQPILRPGPQPDIAGLGSDVLALHERLARNPGRAEARRPRRALPQGAASGAAGVVGAGDDAGAPRTVGPVVAARAITLWRCARLPTTRARRSVAS